MSGFWPPLSVSSPLELVLSCSFFGVSVYCFLAMAAVCFGNSPVLLNYCSKPAISWSLMFLCVADCVALKLLCRLWTEDRSRSKKPVENRYFYPPSPAALLINRLRACDKFFTGVFCFFELFIPDYEALLTMPWEGPRMLRHDLRFESALVASEVNFYLLAFSALGVTEAFSPNFLPDIGLNCWASSATNSGLIVGLSTFVAMLICKGDCACSFVCFF